jgi:hypothetical protein
MPAAETIAGKRASGGPVGQICDRTAQQPRVARWSAVPSSDHLTGLSLIELFHLQMWHDRRGNDKRQSLKRLAIFFNGDLRNLGSPPLSCAATK